MFSLVSLHRVSAHHFRDPYTQMSRAAAGSTQAITERGPDHGRATRDGSGPEARFLLESPRALPRDLVPIRFLARPSGRGSGCWARKNGRQGWSLNHQVPPITNGAGNVTFTYLQQVCRFQRPRRPPTTYLVSLGKVLQDLAGSRAQFEEIREFRTHNGLRRWSCPRGHFPAEPTSGGTAFVRPVPSPKNQASGALAGSPGRHGPRCGPVEF